MQLLLKLVVGLDECLLFLLLVRFGLQILEEGVNLILTRLMLQFNLALGDLE